MSLRKDLVPCDRCGCSARIPPSLCELAPPQAERLALARHQKTGPCIIGTFEREMTAGGFVRAGQAWRLIDMGLFAARKGPSSYTAATAPGGMPSPIISDGRWIPRWAAVAWKVAEDGKTARRYAAALARVTEEERAAFLTAFDAGGKAAARLLVWNFTSTFGVVRC